MTQTHIDEFYTIFKNNRISRQIKNAEKLSAVKSPAVNKRKKEIVQEVNPYIHKNLTPRTSKINKRKISTLTGTQYRSTINAIQSRVAMSTMSKQSPATSPAMVKSPGKFTPKTSSPIKGLEKSPISVKTRRRLFNEDIKEIMSTAVNNLNMAKEGAIANNDIDLEKVYSSGEFNYKYSCIDTTTSTRYEIEDMTMPTETSSRLFYSIVANVFSKPFNCGYFNEQELDLIFALLTLSSNALALMIRMLKRKQTWNRTDHIKYDDISTDLRPVFDELVSRSVFKSNIEEEDITVSLTLMQVDEIRKLCQKHKINAGGKKEAYIQSILRFYKNQKPLFPGLPDPATKLRDSISQVLGYCVLINPEVSKVVDRIITLLIPNQNPQQTMADFFHTLSRVESKEVKYPEATVREFPIFANKEHLLSYMEAKSALCNVLNAIEKKQPDVVREIGSRAAARLSLLLDMEKRSLKNSALPNYIRYFMPGYTWLKVLYKSIDAFKKTKDTLPQAIQFLRILVKQKCHMEHRKGQWYNEWMKIEQYHRKDPNASVGLLKKAVLQKSLTRVDRLDLLEKAEKLAKRKSNIDQRAKDAAERILRNELSGARLTSTISSVTIRGAMCQNLLQKKSTWCIDQSVDKAYGTVETFALYDYKRKNYIKGVHCEGSFPLTLFGTLFWDEIYNIDVPGACVSLYEPTPMDLLSSEFYKNRKEQIDRRLREIRGYNAETLSSHARHQFELRREYTSVFQDNVFDDSSSFQEVVLCLGVEGVVGICERLIHNYSLWKAGFPDLIVWNPCTKQYKIVEVKGPGDSLSTKQKLWLDYLNQLGLNTEVCYCESNNRGGHKRKHEAVI